MRNKPGIDKVDIDDLYNNLRVYKDDMKSRDFEVSTAGGINQVPITPSAHDIAYSFLVQPTTSPQLKNEDFQQMDGDDLEELDLRWQVAMLTVRVKKSERSQGRRPYAENSKSNAQIIESSSQALVVKERDELKLKIEKWEGSSKNLTKIINSQMSTHDKNRLGFGTQMDDLSNKSETDSENSLTVFEVRCRNPLTPRPDISFTGLDEYAFRNKIIESKTTETNKTIGTTNEATIVKPKSVNETVVSKSKINRDEVIIEDWTSDDEDDECADKTISSVKPNATQAVRSQADKSGQTLQKQGISFKKVHKIKACFVCKSTDHLIKDCDFYDQKSPEPRVKNVVNTGKREGNPEILLQDHAVVDSGCSSHMTGNKAYLSDYEDFNGGFVAFGSDPKGGKITGKGKIKTANLDFDDVYFVDELKFNLFSVSQMCDKKNSVLFTESECLILSPSFKLLDESQVVLRAPRKDGVYSLDLKNIVPSGGITCLYANATADESKLWHRRLGHVNFKNINKLVKGHLVRGLPSKVFVNDHTCVACKKGKQHKASCKAKLDRIIRKPLELLHMDLFGPVSIESINKKRCDNETEFKNYVMNDLCAKKGIKRECSVARTSQQNGVAERKNRTLIEAARTMLADLLLPILFWVEAVNTACYVLNRVLVTKPQNKTPYELLIVYHSRTKHIEIRHHFIRDCYEKRLIDVLKIHTDSNVADLLTKGFDVTRISMDLRMDRCSAGKFYSSMVCTSLRYALTHNPTIYDSLVNEFWQTATVRTLVNGTQQLVASIDSKEYNITEAFVRCKLQLADATGIHNLSDAEIYAGLATLGYVTEGAVMDQGEGSAQSPPHSPHPSPPFSPPYYSLPGFYEAPLPEGNISGSAEDSVQLKELMKVKSLEKSLKWKSKKVLISESEGEESEDQGKNQDINCWKHEKYRSLPKL
ncbi:putative ribonuclease H-like domain-containing protein [Tanacetum coccineum]